MQRLDHAPVEQRMDRAGGAAARAVNAGRMIEQALRIDGMAGGVHRIEERRGAPAGASHQSDLRASR